MTRRMNLLGTRRMKPLVTERMTLKARAMQMTTGLISGCYRLHLRRIGHLFSPHFLKTRVFSLRESRK